MSDSWAGKGADLNREDEGSSPGALQCITIWILEKDKKKFERLKKTWKSQKARKQQECKYVEARALKANSRP